jgi:hypothetical protein
MKASEAIIAWNGRDSFRSEGRAGSIAVGPLLHDGDSDWTRAYLFTGGAAEVQRRTLPEKEQQFSVLRDFYTLVYVYGLDPYLVHRALLHIDEYQDVIKAIGAGPAKGELGHDPDVVSGQTDYPIPQVDERRIERSFHFSPAE